MAAVAAAAAVVTALRVAAMMRGREEEEEGAEGQRAGGRRRTAHFDFRNKWFVTLEHHKQRHTKRPNIRLPRVVGHGALRLILLIDHGV